MRRPERRGEGERRSLIPDQRDRDDGDLAAQAGPSLTRSHGTHLPICPRAAMAAAPEHRQPHPQRRRYATGVVRAEQTQRLALPVDVERHMATMVCHAKCEAANGSST